MFNKTQLAFALSNIINQNHFCSRLHVY